MVLEHELAHFFVSAMFSKLSLTSGIEEGRGPVLWDGEKLKSFSIGSKCNENPDNSSFILSVVMRHYLLNETSSRVFI